MACAGDQSRGEVLRERAAELLQLAGDRAHAKAQRELQEPQLLGEAAPADSAAPHSNHQDSDPGASCEAAADTLAQEQQRRPAEQQQHSSSAQSDAGPGLGSVVWGREKSWPRWPALLITKETSRGLCNLRKPQNQCPLASTHRVLPDSPDDSFSRNDVMVDGSRARGILWADQISHPCIAYIITCCLHGPGMPESRSWCIRTLYCMP